MKRQLQYTINSTRYGVRTITGRYNTACLWAVWGEDDVLVVNETGVLIAPELLIKWTTNPGDGSCPSLEDRAVVGGVEVTP